MGLLFHNLISCIHLQAMRRIYGVVAGVRSCRYVAAMQHEGDMGNASTCMKINPALQGTRPQLGRDLASGKFPQDRQGI